MNLQFPYLNEPNMSKLLLPIAALLILAVSAHAQTAATLTDAGGAAPTPGANDIAQLSVAGDQTFPDGLNYYTDNQTGHGAGEPGQTFTTGSGATGYTLTSLYLRSAGLDSGGGSPGESINYLLHIYSVSGGNVTLLHTYSAGPVGYTEGDWLHWTGLSDLLSPGTTYAYSFGKANGSGGWDAIGVAGGNPYAGGEIGLIPPGGGAITFGGSHAFDASFVVGLTAVNGNTPPVISSQPVSAALYAGLTATFAASANGVGPLTYHWRENGTNLTDTGNVSGSGTSTLTLSKIQAADVAAYTLLVSNSFGSVTSSVANLKVISATAAYPNVVVADGPVAYWRFNETVNPATGNALAYDYAGGFNGTYGTAAQNGFNGVAGPQAPYFSGFEGTNYALEDFAGVDASWVTLPPLNLTTNTVTLTAWINPNGIQALWSGILMARNGDDAAGFSFGGSANELAYTWDQNSGNTWGFDSGVVVPTNQWSLVALVVTSTNATLYALNTNGVASSVNVLAHTVETFGGGTIAIGDDPVGDASRVYNGAIDEVAVFAYALSTQQLQALYDAGAGGLMVWSPTAAISTADLTLNQPGLVVGAAVFGGTEKVVTLTNGTAIDFKADGSVATATGTSTGNNCFPGNQTGATTGNTNFDAVLTQYSADGGPKTITLNRLVPGAQYSVQLFALDDRTTRAALTANFADPNNPLDLSSTLTMGENNYVIGTFTAFGTTENIIENLPNGGAGNMNALVVRIFPSVRIGNLSVTNVTSTQAALAGTVNSTDGTIPTVNVFYGPTDGGTNATAWANKISAGQQNGSFTTPLTGLTPSTTYYVTAEATNGTGAQWAGSSIKFTTLPPATPAMVTNLPASNVSATAATLNGQVLATGGQTPAVTIYYGPADEGTNLAAWANNVYLGPQTGTFTVTVSGLAPNTPYYFAAVAANDSGNAWAAPSGTFTTAPTISKVAVLTYHNDNTRDGANTNEVILTPGNVNQNNFGLIFSRPVDGYVYAEPLVMTNVTIPGQGVHDIVFVATEHASMYAFDADNGTPLWQTNFGVSAATPNNNFGNRYGPYHDINPEVGITGTPVIDPASGTLYVDVFTSETAGYFHRVHAIDIATGMDRPYSPVVVAASIPGIGVQSANGVLPFVAETHLQRAAMTLANGTLFVTYTGYADSDPYHGWIIGFNAATLKPLTNYVFNTSPNSTIAADGGNAGECGLWMSGNGLSVDSSNNLYFEVANGPFNANTNGTQYGDSFMRLSTSNGLAVADYFTPYNQASLAAGDVDLGSGGPMLLPDSVGSTRHPHLIVGCGKEGTIHLVDRDNMGHYNAANDNQIVQELGGAIGGVWSSPAYFNHLIYYLGTGDVLKGFPITNGVITTTPLTSATAFGSSATPEISANGVTNGIVWVVQTDAYLSRGPAVLHAYNARTMAELYNSDQNFTRDNPGATVKFNVPTVANGKVYVGAEYALSVYGNAVFIGNPVIAPGGGAFTNSVVVSFTDPTPGVSFYYTLDGATPTTNSPLYAGPFTLTASAGVQVMAVKGGAVNSAVVSAVFVNTASIGNGSGLTGAYYSNQNLSFNGSPKLVRTDATVNFNWGTAGPAANVGATDYSVRWTGTVQPQFSESYTFYATTDDGVRLWVNGNELINQWPATAAGTYSNTVTLNAQELYNIELDYFHGTGSAAVELAWSSHSTPLAAIPQAQLYPATNPPPVVTLTSPANGASYTESASVTLGANAAAQSNSLAGVAFYANNTLLGTVSNAPYVLTATGLAAGDYTLSAVVTDGSGLTGTSAPVSITVQAGSGLPYGLTGRSPSPAFYNMPAVFTGTRPPTLSQTGVFTNTPAMDPAPGLIPYAPNTPLWSDGAVKSRWLAVPYQGGLTTPDQQIDFAPTGEWSFPNGTVFVKHFALITNYVDTTAPPMRLETRLLVRDTNGAVYGVTYKWRPDYSDADLLTSSATENITITVPGGTITQTWYYPSPADCLTCHTPAANYVLGVKTRQLNGDLTYGSTGVTDNQLRALNRLGLFNPAIDEAAITTYARLVSITNQSASLEDRFRSYIDANCAQCHRPGGTGPTFDARYDTPLTNQNIINAAVLKGNLGADNAKIVTPNDTWRSVLYLRADTLDPATKMPPLARNLIDTNAVTVMAAWIDSLPGTPTLPPPVIQPAGGTFAAPVSVTLLPPDTNAVLYYTLDGSLPTTNSAAYTGAFTLSSTAVVSANAFEPGFVDSVAASAAFTVTSAGSYFTTPGIYQNGVFQMTMSGVAGDTYVLQATTNFSTWISLETNVPGMGTFNWIDTNAANYPLRFYRVIQQP